MLERITKIVDNLIKNQIRIAFAESCTGGYISHMFTNISGVSNTFDRAIICYSNASKIQLLNVDPKTIEENGAVSGEVAKQLAFNVRILSDVDLGIGITGIAGPTGGTEEKPVGLVYIGFSTEKETDVKKFQFHTHRIDFKKKVLEKILDHFEA